MPGGYEYLHTDSYGAITHACGVFGASLDRDWPKSELGTPTPSVLANTGPATKIRRISIHSVGR
jgi:hypothetical protein